MSTASAHVARALRCLGMLLAFLGGTVHAADFSYYDLDRLGVPQFVNLSYIDLAKISQISKFRSSAGHDYHDDAEICRSMKHYFIAPDATVTIRAPVAGVVYRLNNDTDGRQVQITSDLQPGFTFILFHVNLAQPLAIGDHISEGQILGTHIGPTTFSDIAVGVNTPTGYRLVSYFETLTDAGFAPFAARGVLTRAAMIIPKGERDAAPYQCNGEGFINLAVRPDTEYFTLTAAEGGQTIAVSGLPTYARLGDSPIAVTATATSGLPVAIGTNTAAVCTVLGTSVILHMAGVCSITFSQIGNATVARAPQVTILTNVLGPAISTGPIFSSVRTDAQSFLRFYNAGNSPSVVTLALADYVRGQTLAQWTSPSIPPGVSRQFSIAEIETGTGQSFAKPNYYAVTLAPSMSGAMQHVLWQPSTGTLTNLTTCSAGVTTAADRLINVHSSLFNAGYPSSVVINNTGATLQAVQLGIYDAANGTRLGAYVPPPPRIAAYGQNIVSIAAIEAAANVTPGSGTAHYIIKNETATPLFLQHLVTNQQTGVITDMTTLCSFDAARQIPLTTAIVQPGPIYSSTQATSQSFLRFFNTGDTPGPVSVTLASSAAGCPLAQWTSPDIPAGASLQFSIGQIESGADKTFTKPQYYSLSVESQIAGLFQYILFRPSDGTLTNLSTCDNGVTADPARMMNVHSSLFDGGYLSTIAITNTGTVAQSVTLGVYNARDGAKLGSVVTAPIAPHGEQVLPVSDIEVGAHVTPSSAALHYVIKIDAPFTGFLQHIVTNLKAGVVTDMTTACALPPAKILSFKSCPTGSGAQCFVGADGIAVTGQLKRVGGYDYYGVPLVQGRTYIFEVRGTGSAVGTLAAPSATLYNPSVGFIGLHQDGGAGHDVRFSYTAQANGTHFLWIRADAYTNADGTISPATGTYSLSVHE